MQNATKKREKYWTGTTIRTVMCSVCLVCVDLSSLFMETLWLDWTAHCLFWSNWKRLTVSRSQDLSTSCSWGKCLWLLWNLDTRDTAHCFSHEVVCRFELRHVFMTGKDGTGTRPSYWGGPLTRHLG